MRYWWVNQNQTYKHETQSGFLWSPKHNKGGGKNPFYDNMLKVVPGDLVLSFCDTLIKAIGVAQGVAVSSSKPDFGHPGDQWSDDGWRLPVEFVSAENPVRPKDFIAELIPHLPPKYAPLQANGNGNQAVYLTEITKSFAEIILGKMGLESSDFAVTETPQDVSDVADEQALDAILGRTDIGETQKLQMIQARRGQGIFRANVRLNETRCRVTGISDPKFLIASHIKPWRDCTDQEKLDGCNGLLLSPHVDHLFDKHLISFNDDGTIVHSPNLPAAVCLAWGLDIALNVGKFNAAQSVYLSLHRASTLGGKQ